MIHQLIFASPKPGMTERQFQTYWIEEHAVKYASKIPQIRRYLVDARVPFNSQDDAPLFGGVAEIWLENEQEQLASLQTEEFLDGARVDEPRWAAFWKTVVLDTTAHDVVESKLGDAGGSGLKVLVLTKRHPGISLAEFRHGLLHDPPATGIPGLRRYVQCHTRDGAYALGEPRFDCVLQLWFDDVDTAKCGLDHFLQLQWGREGWGRLVDSKYVFPMLVREHLIIGPEFRGPANTTSSPGVSLMTVHDANSTRAVAEKWFAAVARGDADTAATCLADDVEWYNYTKVPRQNDIMPWIGTYRGRDEVMRSFGVFLSVVAVKFEKLLRLIVDGEEAAGVVHEISTVKETGKDFEIEFVQWLTIRDGQIVRWKSYTDPSSIVAAMKG